jgi:hypothetical protein
MALLPYMEQQNVTQAMVTTVSVNDPTNWPPPWGTSTAASTTVASYLCPSTPKRSIDYAPWFVSLGLPNRGPFLIGGTDYNAVKGARGSFRTNCANTMPNPPDDSGVLGVKGVMEPTMELSVGKARFADVLDGTSNSIVFGETCGRHQVYSKGRKEVIPSAPGQPGWILNAAYFDYNTAINVRGFSGDGLTPDAGCFTVNVLSQVGAAQAQFYSFHPGVAATLRTDGSIQFVSETITPTVMAALVTRAGSEPVSDN